MDKTYDILLDIVHTASAAMVNGDTAIRRQALADIADDVRRTFGGDGNAEARRLHDALYPEQVKWLDETQQIARDALNISPASADGKTSKIKRVVGTETPCAAVAGDRATSEPQGFAKFMTVAPGVTLVRFAGRDEIKLVARRKGASGNPNTIFEIDVDKAEKLASVYRDERLLFRIKGLDVGYNKVEAMAVSALNRWFKNQRKRNSRRRRRAAKLREGILTPEMELADTIARQKDMG